MLADFKFSNIYRPVYCKLKLYLNQQAFKSCSIGNQLSLDVRKFYCHYQQTKQKNSVAWVRERTIPAERTPLVGEVIANFCG
jgi:hypothetical protein